MTVLTTLTRATFTTALTVALLGGLALIAWQSVGLVVGSGAVVTAPNGVFKTVICVAASIAAIAAYLLTLVVPPVTSGATQERDR